MYITYNYLNTCNIDETEGIGSQYQKIISIYAVARKNNIKYIHIPINVGHNYNNDKDWNLKWDKMFNFQKLAYNHEIDIETIEKEFFIDNCPYQYLLNNKNENKLYFYFHNFELFNENTEYYFKDIQDDLIDAYNETNNNRKLIYDKNKTNIAIHIRTHNDFDLKNFYNDYIDDNNTNKVRHNLNCEMYIKLIKLFKERYENSDIHIFSQEKYFDIKFKNLRNIENINIHFDDIDVFDTFHHLCKADILVTAESSFSYIAALYNKNIIIHCNFYSCALNTWIKYDKVFLD